jgi:hypothetical protein
MEKLNLTAKKQGNKMNKTEILITTLMLTLAVLIKNPVLTIAILFLAISTIFQSKK